MQPKEPEELTVLVGDGNDRVLLVDFQETMGKVLSAALRHVPPEHLAEAQEDCLSFLDGVIQKARPARAGEIVLRDEEAQVFLRGFVGELRRGLEADWGG